MSDQNINSWRAIGCTRKVRYKNQQQAFHYGAIYGQVTYRCGFCDGYHLTTKGLRGKRQ